ncbi:MAG TPA: sigma-70 family RNA polymerase sigma factor [Methylomirabilota bacterium]|nr:sigma-70 family RNA polymerase sigma factor [Methylomirabilota bacterium]
MDSDDQALVERSRNGDLAAFEPLVEKYRERVWRLAYNYLRDREEAWDVAQEAFVRAWQALPSFRGQSAFYTWLFRIVVNVATDRARPRAARGRAFGTETVPEEEWERVMVDQEAGPEDTAARAEQRERIRRGLEALPEHHRAIIMLSDLEGLSYREIAQVLQIPMGTVMSRLHNARKRLREVLRPLLVALLVVLASLALPASAPAQQVVRFGARVLLASDGPPPPGTRLSPPGPDARLEAFLPRLRQLFRYREYASLERFLAEVPVGTTQRWSVPGDRQLEVTPEAVAAGAVRLRVRLQRGSMSEVSTNIQAARGNPAVIGGPRYADGVLIIIVWANANP